MVTWPVSIPSVRQTGSPTGGMPVPTRAMSNRLGHRFVAKAAEARWELVER